MEKLKILILPLGAFFLGFLVLIGSVAGIVQMLFMTLIYLSRNHLRSAMRRIVKNNFVLVVVFGTIFGVVEEVLWFVSEPGIRQTMFGSLYVDLVSTFPAYLIFYVIIYIFARHCKTTGEKAFLYGGIFGYFFYFIAESGLFGFHFGGVPGAPVWLILIWEINNFFLNGLLVWFPLYLSDLYVERSQPYE